MAGVGGQVVEYREFLEAAEAEYSRHLVRINAEETPEDVYLSFCDAIESSLWASRGTGNLFLINLWNYYDASGGEHRDLKEKQTSHITEHL